MKKITSLAILALVPFTLAACGNTNSQSKENSSLKAENSSLKARKENESLKAENSRLKNKKDTNNNSQQNQTSGASSQSSSIATSADAIAKLRAAEGFNGPGYDFTCDSIGNGVFRFWVRQDVDDTPANGHTAFVGNFEYDSKTDSITKLS